MKLRLSVALAIAAMMALAAGASTASAQTITYRAGPFHINGFQTLLPKLRVRAPQMDGYITKMNATLHYGNGRRVSIRRVMLHHIVFLNDGQPNNEPGGSCKGRKGEPFYGTGEEREQMLLPKGYGYPVHHADRWRMQTMLMSHSFEARNVYVQYTFTFTEQKLTPVRPFWIRANGCTTDQPSYSVQQLSSGLDHRTFHWTVPMNGRIVAAGGHLHGGAITMSLTQPGCDDRKLLDTDPLFAPRNDLVYTIRPILHEPGPVGTRFFQSRTGIGVTKGEKLDLQADYQADVPRARVMSIMHVYIAYGKAVARASAQPCAALPKDSKEILLRTDGHLSDPPYVKIPFNVVGANGGLTTLAHLPGSPTLFDGPAQVRVVNNSFKPAKLSIPLNGQITWTFADRIGHNVLFASGPQVVGTPTLSGGVKYTSRGFLKPGDYQFFCYLHPITMHQEVIVRDGDGSTKTAAIAGARAEGDTGGGELPRHAYFDSW
jgi:plastocyanin